MAGAIGVCVIVALAGVIALDSTLRRNDISIDETDFSVGIEVFGYSNIYSDYAITLHSNGSASWSSWMFWEGPQTYKNYTVEMNPDTALDFLHALEDEGFLTLEKEHEDPGASNLNASTRLTMKSGEESLSIDFKGNSMIGILPNSFVTMDYIIGAVRNQSYELINATMRVGIDLSIPSQTVIGAVLENNASHTLTGPYAGEPSLWRALIVSEEGTTVARFPESVDPSVDLWGDAFGPHTQTTLASYTWDSTGIHSGRYIVMGEVAGGNANVAGFTILTVA